MLKKAICWWFGCDPDYDHPCELSPNYVVSCKRCGASDTSYSDRVEDTRHQRMVDWLRYWLFRRWSLEKCGDCGRRFGKHEGCLPF